MAESLLLDDLATSQLNLCKWHVVLLLELVSSLSLALLMSVYSTPGNMDDASKVIFDPYIGILPTLNHVN